MCLALGEKNFCLVLRCAPYYNGMPLDALQHGIDENRADTMNIVNEGMELAIAIACGLALDEYRKLTIEVRSQNARWELLHSPITIGNGMAHFWFPRNCADFIERKIDDVPVLPMIDDATQTFTATFLTKCREAYRPKIMQRRLATAEPGSYVARRRWISVMDRVIMNVRKLYPNEIVETAAIVPD